MHPFLCQVGKLLLVLLKLLLLLSLMLMRDRGCDDIRVEDEQQGAWRTRSKRILQSNRQHISSDNSDRQSGRVAQR